MTNYYKRLNTDPFKNLPLTFHIENGTDDAEFKNFGRYFSGLEIKIKQSRIQLRAAEKARLNKFQPSATNDLPGIENHSFFED